MVRAIVEAPTGKLSVETIFDKPNHQEVSEKHYTS